MTLTEAQAMTPEQKRVKLAELLGWKFNVRKDELWWTYRPTGLGSGMSRKLTYDEIFCIFSIPDYCRDLNAVAQVERMLVTDDRDRTGTYERHLSIITDKRSNPETESEFCYPMFATADQRTTALILTLSQA